MTQVRILIADDHEVVRSGLRALLAARSGWAVVGEAVDGDDAVGKAVDLKPDVAILDYGLPFMSGAEATREIRARVPSVEVLIFTMRNDDELIREVFEVGARGYLLKSDAKEDLYAAVESVAEHRPFFTRSISRMLLDAYLASERVESDPLTSRERLVVQMIAEGKTNKETARELNLSVKTVETHRSNAMEKLGVSSLGELVRYAVRTKLVEP
jgi:DNA-binding NarL/FixJ family response regulator